LKRTCKECGKEFELTDGEIHFYKEKGLDLPKRCKECREANQEQRQKNKSSTKAEDRKRSGNVPVKENIQPEKVSPQPKVSAKSGRVNKYIAAIVTVIALCFGHVLWDGAGDLANDSSVNRNTEQNVSSSYSFRNEEYLAEHFKKHGAEFGYKTEEEYEAGANRVIASEDVLHKTEREDGDDIYYLESSNEFVVVSTDGYLRTYFKPDDGMEYYNRQ